MTFWIVIRKRKKEIEIEKKRRKSKKKKKKRERKIGYHDTHNAAQIIKTDFEIYQ